MSRCYDDSFIEVYLHKGIFPFNRINAFRVKHFFCLKGFLRWKINVKYFLKKNAFENEKRKVTLNLFLNPCYDFFEYPFKKNYYICFCIKWKYYRTKLLNKKHSIYSIYVRYLSIIMYIYLYAYLSLCIPSYILFI